MYTLLLYIIKIPRTYYIAQGTLFNVMFQPGWNESLGENRYMDMCVYMHIYVHVYTYRYICVCVFVCVYICVAKSLCLGLPETITLIGYTLTQNKTFNKK